MISSRLVNICELELPVKYEVYSVHIAAKLINVLDCKIFNHLFAQESCAMYLFL